MKVRNKVEGSSADSSSGCIILGENKIKGRVINSSKYVKELIAFLKKDSNNNIEIK